MDERLARYLAQVGSEDSAAALKAAANLVSGWPTVGGDRMGSDRLASVLGFLSSQELAGAENAHIFLNRLLPDLGDWNPEDRGALIGTIMVAFPRYDDFAAKLVIAEAIGLHATGPELVAWLSEAQRRVSQDREATVRAAWIALGEVRPEDFRRRDIQQWLERMDGDPDDGVHREASTAIESLKRDGFWG